MRNYQQQSARDRQIEMNLLIHDLVGATGMACVPIIQTRIMEKARDAPTLAAAANHSAFNLANAAGAFLGGRAIGAGLGWTSPDWVGAILAAGGLALALLSGALDRRYALDKS